MSDSDLVSVIIPTYNRAYCVERAIDSVLGQTHREVEVVLIDDGSTDGTADLIVGRYGGDKRVRYFRQNNCGISGARNAGLERAQGGYVAFLDSDDEWVPWKLELQVACLRAHPELGMTWTNMMAIEPGGRVISDSFLRQMYDAYRWFPTAEDLFKGREELERITPRAAEICPGRRFYFGDIGDEMFMGNLVHTSTVVLTRDRARAVGTFREDLRFAGEDYEYHLRTCQKGPVGYLDVSSIRYMRGQVDQASAPANSIHLALNFLRVVEPVLTSNNQPRRIPPHMRKTVLADAYAWVGECRLSAGEAGEARAAFLRSLRFQPYQPRTARLLFAACLPRGLRDAAHRLYKAARRART
jgi:GT2 family glycosyltransferase